METVKYRVQLELTIETEKGMEELTSNIHRVVASMRHARAYGFQPVNPDFPSVEIEQLTVKRLETE